MVRNVAIGRELGHIRVPDGMQVEPRDLDKVRDKELVIITTGSQGEPLAALRRMAYNEHRQVLLHAGDTVVFSANSIPGNERAVNDTIDRLIHLGCDVVTNHDAPIHTSGHGHREELKLMLNITRPKYLLPVHGDHKRIRLHAELGEAVGIAPEHIFRSDNGLPLEITADGAALGPREHAGMILRRRRRPRPPDHRRAARPPRDLRRRHRLRGGDRRRTGRQQPRRTRSGAPRHPAQRGRGQLAEALRDAVEDALDRAATDDVHEREMVEQIVTDDLAEFLFRRLSRRPMILARVIEV